MPLIVVQTTLCSGGFFSLCDLVSLIFFDLYMEVFASIFSTFAVLSISGSKNNPLVPPEVTRRLTCDVCNMPGGVNRTHPRKLRNTGHEQVLKKASRNSIFMQNEGGSIYN